MPLTASTASAPPVCSSCQLAKPTCTASAAGAGSVTPKMVCRALGRLGFVHLYLAAGLASTVAGLMLRCSSGP